MVNVLLEIGLLAQAPGEWWNLDWSTIWPIAQYLLAPFAGVVQILAGIMIFGTIATLVLKRLF